MSLMGMMPPTNLAKIVNDYGSKYSNPQAGWIADPNSYLPASKIQQFLNPNAYDDQGIPYQKRLIGQDGKEFVPYHQSQEAKMANSIVVNDTLPQADLSGLEADIDKQMQQAIANQQQQMQQQQFNNIKAPKKTTEADKGTDWFSGRNLFGIAGAVANPLLATLDRFSGNSNLERIREKEVDQALQQNLANRDSLLSQSPEANRLAKANALQMGRSGAVNAASATGASNMANAGMNGDMSSALIAGVQAAAPVAAATQGYDQALANTFTERANEQQVLNQQIGQNTMDRGTLAEMTAYYDRGNQGWTYRNMLDLIAGGQGVGDGMYRIFSGSANDKVKNKVTP